jgi:DNA-binding transcriptional ArsR family regulator
MSLTSPLGDGPITDPQAMRALAHPVRLAVLSYLQRHGPATATHLAPHVGATPSVTSWHLRHLASFGLVLDADPSEVPGDRRQRWWKAAARGSSLEAGEDAALATLGDAEAEAAGRAPADQLIETARQQVDRWIVETGPELDDAWRRLAGISSTTIMLTAVELEGLAHGIDELLAPYANRLASEVPADARRVRVLRHYLPDATQR